MSFAWRTSWRATCVPWPLLLVGVFVASCAEPPEAGWKKALAEGKVIPLPKSERRAPAAIAHYPLSNVQVVDQFRVPPPPTVDSVSADESQVAPEKMEATGTKGAATPESLPTLPLVRPAEPVHDPKQVGPAPIKPPTRVFVVDQPLTVAPENIERLDELVRQCRAVFQELTSYSAVLTREEVVGDKPQERQAIRIATDCKSGQMRLEWLDTNREGRQIVLNPRQPTGELEIAPGRKEPRLLGDRLTIAPDHFLVRMGNRHPVYKVGLESWIADLETIWARQAENDPRGGRLELLGQTTHERIPGRKLYHIRQHSDERATLTLLPPGGRRDWYIDARVLLPVLVLGFGPAEEKLEDYQISELRLNPLLTDADLTIR